MSKEPKERAKICAKNCYQTGDMLAVSQPYFAASLHHNRLKITPKLVPKKIIITRVQLASVPGSHF